MTTPKPSTVAWVLAAAGDACAVYAAFLAGGLIAALGAASTALTGAAALLGYAARPTPGGPTP